MLHQLAQLAHPMCAPIATRRSAQAAQVVLSLIGGEAAQPVGVEPESSHLRVHLRGFSLWATRCDPPLLLDDAAVLAAAARRDVLIVRIATSLHPAPLMLDWIPAAPTSAKPRCGLLPALPHGGGLALVDQRDEDFRVDVTGDGIRMQGDLPAGWSAQRQLAVARAAAVLNQYMWGGL